MSTEDIAGKDDNDVSVCANCGKGEEESHKLKHCTACMLVKYCNRDCQIAHRPMHKKECKKRAAELHDEKLFKQPPQEEDCPICFQLLPTFSTGRRYKTCCGKEICSGCVHAPVYDDQGNKVDNNKQNECAFCRTLAPKSDEEGNEREKKRMEKGDPIAMYNLGCYHRDGLYGFPQDYTKALELYHRATEFGYAKAYCKIGIAYYNGEGVEVDKKKARHYYELAAMGGNVQSRHNLGIFEREEGNMNRALKHYMISARGGYSKSVDVIKEMYTKGFATKEDYTTALRSYQTYLGEIKSRQRDEAAAFNDRFRYYESGV